MVQFLIDPKAISNGGAKLKGEEARHARDVMRVQVGDAVRLFDGQGKGYEGKVAKLSPAAIDVEELKPFLSPTSRVQLSLAQSLLPHSAMDDLVHKATELGMKNLIPIVTRRTIVRLDGAKRDSKKEHWQKITLAACKQCDRLDIPVVRDVMKFEDLPKLFGEFDLVILCEPLFPEETLKVCLARVFSVERILIVTGPEGGFTEDEVKSARAKGARCVSLGSGILKSETAAIFALSVLRYLNE